MKGKIILIEGTDCSGKETQSKLLIERLNKEGIKCEYFSFPAYDSPTGKIIGGPYLGKSYIMDGWFDEGASKVDPYVSSLYFAADRKYNIKKILDKLDDGINVVLDRYLYSNMAHQGAKMDTANRIKMFKFIEQLELNMLGLPDPEIKIFLHMPYEGICKLKSSRAEVLDQHEQDNNHLIKAEETYKLIVDMYDFKTIECMNKEIRTIEDISNDVYDCVYHLLKKDIFKK